MIEDSEKAPIPNCIGIIMDGNRRWAKKKGVDTFEGHEEGFKKIRSVVEWAIEAKIPNLIFYAFSTENWNRSQKEVSYLLSLLESAVRDRLKDVEALGVRLRIIGERERFDKRFQSLIEEAEKRSQHNTKLMATIALSYGGRAEILRAANQLIIEGRGHVSEEDFTKQLWTNGIPDPDIIIRTSGEKRLSNFLPWQSVYSELFFVDTLWPDFSKEEFSAIVEQYASRSRRNGK